MSKYAATPSMKRRQRRNNQLQGLMREVEIYDECVSLIMKALEGDPRTASDQTLTAIWHIANAAKLSIDESRNKSE